MGPIPDFRGEQVVEGDSAYDDARAVFNAMVDRRPALIARCADEGDVVAALAYARDAGLAVAVRAGGHSVAGLSLNEGGVVIDVRGAERGQRRRAAPGRALRRRRDLVGVRPPDAGVRAGDHRRARVEHRGGRADAGRRLGLARAPVRPHLRQPARGRAGHGGGRARPRERGREPGAVLGAAGRRRQLRRGHRARVPAARGRPDGLRRARAVRPGRRARGRDGVPRLPFPRSRRGRARARVRDGAARAVRPARVAGPRDAGASPACGRARRRTAPVRSAACSAPRSRSSTCSASCPTPSSSR